MYLSYIKKKLNNNMKIDPLVSVLIRVYWQIILNATIEKLLNQVTKIRNYNFRQ